MPSKPTAGAFTRDIPCDWDAAAALWNDCSEFLTARGLAYGPVRRWGSATFILGTFAAGYAADVLPARHLIWLIVAAILLCALAAFTLAPLSTAAPTASEPLRPQKSLLRDWECLSIDDAIHAGIRACVEARRTDEPTRMMQAFINRKSS